MFQYRQVLVRLRAGDTTREIARSGLMGRDKAGELRTLALSRGWLDAAGELPDDEAIAAALKPGRRASSTISSVEPFRETVQRCVDAGVQSRAIHAALKREHAFAGSYSAVVRMARTLRAAQPPEVTVRLSFAPAEAAQVDFGAGPVLTHPDGKQRRTWAFVMTLCHSRHQYVEFVWDQSSATWLGCHRRAFEWFDGVPERVTVDNAKCAIVKACRHDPLVQRAYYSAPFTLVGKTLWLRATDGAVTLYQDYRHLYTHPRARRPGERITNPEHMPPDARAFFRHDRRWCHERALAIGAHCAELIDSLLSERIAERLRAAQSVIALARRYSPARVDVACQRAIAHGNPLYVTVKTMLATGADLDPIASAETPSAYRRTRFTRSAADLFANVTTTLQ